MVCKLIIAWPVAFVNINPMIRMMLRFLWSPKGIFYCPLDIGQILADMFVSMWHPIHGAGIHAAERLRPGEGGGIAAVAFAEVEAVTGDGITHGSGAEALDSDARGDDPGIGRAGQHLTLDGVQNGLIHGGLIASVAGKRGMGAVTLVCPGHVPVDAGMGTVGLDIVQYLVLAGVYITDS